MNLCEELLVALEGECVFYGSPVRKRGEPVDPRRLFKLNGLWFEVTAEKRTETREEARWLSPQETGPGFVSTIEVERIVSVDFVTSHDVGPVTLPRPAIVLPGFTDKGNVTFDDAIVTAHRHLVFGNATPIKQRLTWQPTPMRDDQPWIETATGNALAIVEYTTKVRERRDLVEARYGSVIAEIKARELAIQAKARELADAQAAASNPLWGSW